MQVSAVRFSLTEGRSSGGATWRGMRLLPTPPCTPQPNGLQGGLKSWEMQVLARLCSKQLVPGQETRSL